MPARTSSRRFRPPARPDANGVAGLDPLFVNGACRINLGDAPAGITVDASDRFWSVALYDPQGAIVFSLNDRTAVEGRLDMIVVNAEQNAQAEEIADGRDRDDDRDGEPVGRSDRAAPALRADARPRARMRAGSWREAECLPAPSVIPATASGG